MTVSDRDLVHLARCVELASEALTAGDQPFGSVLVAADGTVLLEARNHEGSGDATRHPELELAQWAAVNLRAPGRAASTVYTSGEHCPMCSAAHAWVGLGRIVFASSSAQTAQWYAELGAGASPVRPLAITEVAPGVPTDGPVEPFAGQVRELHRRRFAAQG